MERDAIAYLEKLFGSDPDADDYYEQFRLYQYHRAVGLKPWHPPLSELWRVGEECPDTFPNRAAWREAWGIISRLHSDYLRAKNSARKEVEQ